MFNSLFVSAHLTGAQAVTAGVFVIFASDAVILPLQTNQIRIFEGMRNSEESSSSKSQPQSGTKGPQAALLVQRELMGASKLSTSSYGSLVPLGF